MYSKTLICVQRLYRMEIIPDLAGSLYSELISGLNEKQIQRYVRVECISDK